MELFGNKKTKWNICTDCYGQGKILREPSRKRRRLYQRALDLFENNKDENVPPKSLKKNLDICLDCFGSGLVSFSKVSQVNTDYPNVAIIGGGIGGMALGVACLHRGIPFTIFERDKSFDERAQGYGLTLQQASKAVAGLGIPFLETGITSTRHVVHDPTGKIIGEWGLRKWSVNEVEENSKRKNIHIARQSLRSELLNQLGGSKSIQWNHKFINLLENKNNNIKITFEVNGKIKTTTADLVVGADGVRGSVRSQLIGEDKTPLQYLGCIVILGICSLEALCNIESPLLDSATVFQTVNGNERIYVMPYDKDNIMWQLSFPLSEYEAKELGKKGPSEMKRESLRRLDWHEPIPQILQATNISQITGYPVYDRKLLNPSLLENLGKVTLIGDAAHPMSPFKGQGANQALLDALDLARMISVMCGPNSHWKKNGIRKTLLNTFEKEMIKRTTPKVVGSAKAVELLHSHAVLHEGDEPRGRGIYE